jgi:hypothetical protein
LTEARELWRRVPFQAFPLGDGTFAVHVSGRDGAQILPEPAVDFVQACCEFRTIEQQVARFANAHGIDPADRRELLAMSEGLAAAGLLVSTADLRSEWEAISARASSEPARMAAITFPTNARTALLRRAVLSYMENARQHGRTVEYVVGDNSRDPAVQRANREMLRQLSADSGCAVFLAGESRKRRFAAALADQAGVDPAIIEFALFGLPGCEFTGGANRNALLLDQAGAPFCMADDDSVCRLAAPPNPRGGIALISARDGLERYFFESHEAALASADFVEKDFSSLHEQLLGSAPAGSLADANEIHWQQVTDEFLARLRRSDARVLVTFPGHLGDPGVPTSCLHLCYRGESFARLVHSEPAYRTALRSRSCHHTVPGLAIADASLSFGIALGLDARELLPAFCPVLRAEDFVFGATLWNCFPHAFTGHIPEAVCHLPGGPRQIVAPDDLTPEHNAVLWDFGQLLRAIVLGYQPRPAENTGPARLRGLGRHLRELAGASAIEFRDFLLTAVLDHQSAELSFREHLLKKRPDAPEFWRSDLERYNDHVRAALSRPDADLPYELRETTARNPAQSRALLQRLMIEFGRLLETWPEIFAAARDLRMEGIRMAEPA